MHNEHDAAPRDLVNLPVATRHPESYLLINQADGTRWRGTHQGRWLAERPPHTAEQARLATRRSADRVRGTVKLAEMLSADLQREQRLALGRCRWCHYAPSVAGRAVTVQACGLCGSEQPHTSTATDVLCRDCAATHALCRHCGGDLEASVERTQYPNPARSA